MGYHLFAGTKNTKGGAFAYLGTYTDIVDCLEVVANHKYDWWHIVEATTMKIVKKNTIKE